MRVGIFLASLGMETREGLRAARKLGARGVQLWVVDNELDPQHLTRSGRNDLMAYMEHLGLERSALCGDLGGFADPLTAEQRVHRTKEMLNLCVDLQTPVLTTHIGVPPKDPNSREYALMLAAVREVAEYAANRDCWFATETGLESPADLLAFLQAVASDGAKVNYDPANLCMNGFDPVEGVLILKDAIVHTHAKDGIYNSANEGEYKEVPLGEGDVDFPEYLAVLRQIDYSGYLTIERETGEDPVADVAAAVRFLKQQEGVEA